MFDEHGTKVAMVKNCAPNPLSKRQLDTSGQEVPQLTALKAYFTRSLL